MEQSESGLTNGYLLLTFESIDEIQWCQYSIDTSSTVLSHGTIYLVHSLTNDYVVLTFESVDEILGVTIQMKPLQQCFHIILYILS